MAEAEYNNDKNKAEEARLGLFLMTNTCEQVVDLLGEGKQWREEIVTIAVDFDYCFVRGMYPQAFFRSILKKAMGKSGAKKIIDYLKQKELLAIVQSQAE